jgi:hypothetical protein
VVAGDFNGDGILDLAVADFQTQQVSVLLGNGDGSFQTVKAYPTGANPSSIVAADFNGDGKVDLALTSTPLGSSPGNLVSLLLGNGDGTFGPPTLFGAGYLSYSSAVGDFNRDGTLDLAVANGGSNTVSVLLNTQGTAMTFLSSGNPSIFGQSVALTTTVSASVSNGAVPTGTVTVKNGSAVLGSGALVSGQFSLNTTTLPVGADALSAIYSGDTNYQKHTVDLTQTVTSAGTSTALSSSANPASPNQSITFTATVTSNTTGQATGTVTFKDGTTTLGSSTVDSSGVSTFSTSTLAIGTHNVTAVYGGDGNFTSSTSPVVSQVISVNPAFALTASALLPSSVVAGGSSSSTITISTSGGLDPSSVQLTCSNILPATSVAPACTFSAITVSGGVGTATLTVSTTGPTALLKREHSKLFYAMWFLLPAAGLGFVLLPRPRSEKFVAMVLVLLISGGVVFEAACGGSSSTTTTPPPTKSASSTVITSSANPSMTGQALTITAKVSASSGTPTGTVTFLDGNTNLSTGTLANGAASFQASNLTAGTHTLTAAYGGDPNFNSSTSAALSQIVDRPGTASGTYTITITGNANGVQHTASVTLTVQ